MARRRKNPYASGRRRRKSGRPVVAVLDAVIKIMSVVAATLLLLSYLAPVVNPNKNMLLALLGLVSPMLYLANLLLLFYWIIRWKLFLIVPALALLVGIGNVTTFFNPGISKRYLQEQEETGLRIISYNVRGFYGYDDKGKVISYFRDIAGYLNNSKADIIAIQEFEANYKSPQKLFDSLMSNYRFRAVYYNNGNKSGKGVGLAVYSRYPIAGGRYISFEGSRNAAMWADVVIGKRDTIRVFNNHLQSMRLNREEKEMFSYEALAESDSKRLKGVLGKVRRGFAVRASQADTMAVKIAAAPGAVIVCGDFNDTPMSYVYRKMRGDLKDCFTEKSRGLVYTYNGIFSVFRIDYIFHSRELETISYQSVDVNWSDHNPVEAVMSYKGK